MAKVRVGFIGTGRISDLHQLGYRDNPTGELVAVADVDAAVGKSQANKWGVKTVYSDYRKLLDDKSNLYVAAISRHDLHGLVKAPGLFARFAEPLLQNHCSPEILRPWPRLSSACK